MATNLAEILRPTTSPVTAQEVQNRQPAPQTPVLNAPQPDPTAAVARNNTTPPEGNWLQRMGQNPMLLASLLGIGATLSNGGTIPQALLSGMALVGLAGKARDDRVKREQQLQTEQQRLGFEQQRVGLEGERLQLSREGQEAQTEYNKENLALRREDQEFDRQYKLASLNESRAAHGAGIGLQRANYELRLQEAANEKEYKKNALAISLYGQLDKDIASLYADPLAEPKDTEMRVAKRIELTNKRLTALGLPTYDPESTITGDTSKPVVPDDTGKQQTAAPSPEDYIAGKKPWVDTEHVRTGRPKDQLALEYDNAYTSRYGTPPPTSKAKVSETKSIEVPFNGEPAPPTMSPAEMRASFTKLNELTTTAATVQDLQQALAIADKIVNTGQDPTGRAQYYSDQIRLRITNAGQP